MKKVHFRYAESEGFPWCGGRGYSEDMMVTNRVEDVTCFICAEEIERGRGVIVNGIIPTPEWLLNLLRNTE